MDEKTKYEMVRYRHEDQARLSLHMSDADFKVFSGYITLQVALCSFFAYKVPEMLLFEKVGLSLIDFVLSAVCWLMLYFHFCRRKEVTQTIKNCNEFLGYSTPGFYLKDKSINCKTKNRFWFPVYTIAIVLAYFAFNFILFATCFKN